jgi:hypothetical protein
MRPLPVYGISEWDHNYIKITSRAKELSARAAEAQAAINQHTQQLAGIQGEQHALNYFVSTWSSPYGMQPGMVLRQAEGTGLGSGITSFDGRPIERMNIAPKELPAPAAAMMEDPLLAAARQVTARYALETGMTSAESTKVLDLMSQESNTARIVSSMLQTYTRPGEATKDALLRIIGTAIGKRVKKKAAKRRRG